MKYLDKCKKRINFAPDQEQNNCEMKSMPDRDIVILNSETLNLLKNMNKILLLLLIFCAGNSYAQQKDGIPNEIKKLKKAYPGEIIGYGKNYVLFNDSAKLIFDDGKAKSFIELLKNADIQDMFTFPYPKGEINSAIKKNHDPGRIRNEEFMKKMYGKTANEVQKNLVEIVWCPNLVNQKLKISSKNGVNKQLLAVSAELDQHPEWKEYLRSSGTFNWRVISGTNRLSTHSFGTAIDLNTKYSNFWQWDCKCSDENVDLKYKNSIPQGIVAIFEKHGFIWGGKWYHYDTMHFEYRPELLLE